METKYICIRDTVISEPHVHHYKMGDELLPGFKPNKHFMTEEAIRERDKQAIGG